MVLCTSSTACETAIVGKHFDDKVGQVYNVLFLKDIVSCRVQIYLVSIEKENEKFNALSPLSFVCLFSYAVSQFTFATYRLQYMYLLIDKPYTGTM